MTKVGTLTDFEGTTVRINDIPMPAKPNVMQACRNVLKKKMEVDFTVDIIDGIPTVVNIAPHIDKAIHDKAKANGFGEPTPGPAKQEEKGSCTSPSTPANGAAPAADEKPDTIELNGKCTFMDAPTRTFKIKDIDGAEHPFKWTDPLDVVMMKNGAEKWKVGYYLTVVYNPDTHVVKNVTYWQEGKEKFPKENKGSCGRSYVPRNEKPMIYESVFKSCCDQAAGFPADQTYEQKMMRIWNVAKDISKEIVGLSGA